jgi:hypothetical protein
LLRRFVAGAGPELCERYEPVRRTKPGMPLATASAALRFTSLLFQLLGAERSQAHVPDKRQPPQGLSTWCAARFVHSSVSVVSIEHA